MLGKKDRKGTLHQNFMFKSKTHKICIVDLNIAKVLENMHIHIFLFHLFDRSVIKA